MAGPRAGRRARRAFQNDVWPPCQGLDFEFGIIGLGLGGGRGLQLGVPRPLNEARKFLETSWR
jgi:hypothetical protein